MEGVISAFAGLGWPVLVAAPAVCFLAAALGGMSGMGSGLMITLFITPIVGPQAVLPVISVVMLITNASRFWFLRGAVDLRQVALISAVAVPFAALGALLYVRLESDAIRVLLGAVLVASVPLRRWVAHRKMVAGPPTIVGVSATFGFLGSIVVGANMLIIPLLMGMGLAGTTLIATDAAIAVLLSLSRAIFFGALEALTLPLLVIAVAMGLFTVPGTWLAAWVVRRTSVRIHTIFVEALIVLGGLAMIAGLL